MSLNTDVLSSTGVIALPCGCKLTGGMRVLCSEHGGPYSRFDGRQIRLSRDEAEFLVDRLESTGVRQWMDLAAEIRGNWGMGLAPCAHIHHWRPRLGPSKWLAGARCEADCDCGAELVLPP